MTAKDVRDKLMQTRIAQQEYTLFAEMSKQFDDLFPGECELTEVYHSELASREKVMIATRRLAESYVSLLDRHAEKEIIIRRYIMFQSWEKIAQVMYYSDRQVRRIHNKAIENIARRCP